MKQRTTYLLIGLIIAVLGIGLALGLSQGRSSALCNGRTGTSRTVTIQQNKPSISTVTGALCDRLTFMNKDNITRGIAFGVHDDHVAYDGISEKYLNQNQSFTITLNQVGTFHWHDHLHDEVEGYFSVL